MGVRRMARDSGPRRAPGSLALEDLEMVVDRRRRGQAHSAGDFPNRRRIPARAQRGRDEVQDRTFRSASCFVTRASLACIIPNGRSMSRRTRDRLRSSVADAAPSLVDWRAHGTGGRRTWRARARTGSSGRRDGASPGRASVGCCRCWPSCRSPAGSRTTPGWSPRSSSTSACRGAQGPARGGRRLPGPWSRHRARRRAHHRGAR